MDTPMYNYIVREKSGQEITLGSQVWIGTCDVYGAGIRALSSLTDAAGSSSVEVIPLVIEGCCDPVDPVFQLPFLSNSSAAPLTVINYRSATASQVSMILVNTSGSTSSNVRLLLALLQWLQQRAPESMVCIAAALILPSQPQDGVTTLPINLTTAPPPLDQLPLLLPSTPLKDQAVATLVHILQATGQPAVLLATPGYKLSAYGKDGAEDTAAAVLRLGKAVAASTGLSFDPKVASSISSLRRWYPIVGQEGQSDTGIMYS